MQPCLRSAYLIFVKNARLALGNTKIKAATKQFEGKKMARKACSRINVVLDVIPQCSTFLLYEPLAAASRHVFSSSVMSPRAGLLFPSLDAAVSP